MAINTPQTNATTSDVFIPELWSNEVLAARDSNLVATRLFRSYPHNGKKGDTIHIPNVSNFVANDKAQETMVSIQANTETDNIISIDKHKESSFLIDDFIETQSSHNLRSIYTGRAGYAISKQMDTDLLTVVNAGLGTIIDGDGTTMTDAGAGLTYDGLLEADYLLNAADVPTDGRFIIINPVHRKSIMALDGFIGAATLGSEMAMQMMKSGKVGTILGYEIYMSTNLPTVVSNATDGKVVIVAHKEMAVSAVQKAPRTQGQYMQEYLGTLVTVDTVYGNKALRDDHAVGLRTPIA